MKKAQEELATNEFEATSGGGAVKVTCSGDGLKSSEYPTRRHERTKTCCKT